VEAEAASHGSALSSGTPIAMEQRLTPIHENALADAMRLIVQFSENTNLPIAGLSEAARTRLVTFTVEITERMANAANRINVGQMFLQARKRFDQRVDNALKDVGIGFIEGKRAIMAENTKNQTKALQILKVLYDVTRSKTEPVFIEELTTGLPEEEAKAAWRYLKDRGLIDTFSIPYTARINGAGVDAIEGAQRWPDQPNANFPLVSYNIVYNTMHVGTMQNSPVQQGGAQSTQQQTITFSDNQIADLSRFVNELASHLEELPIDAAQKRKVDAQLATLKAQLSDEPDSVIVSQAGRTLRNILEGAIGSLLATAAQPTVWVWIDEALRRLFA
jgi:cation transport regulator ChaC